MARSTTIAGTNYLVNSTAALTSYPITVLLWIRRTSATTGHRTIWAMGDEGGTANFFWLKFPTEVNTDALLESTSKKNVAFIPGSRFYPEGIERRNELRLNFPYPSIVEIERGVEILSGCIKEHM